MNDHPAQHANSSDDVTHVVVDNTTIVLVGTAHISQESVDTVTRVIEAEQPDVVSVELDEERFRSLRQQDNFEELDLKEVIKNKQLTFLLARLALTAFQKRMGSFTGVKPGADMAAAIDAAEAHGLELNLCDRSVRTTLVRAWRKTPWWRRAEVALLLVAGLFQRTEVNEEDLSDLRQMENISGALAELGDALPEIKSVMVDERDEFMAHKLREIRADKVVAVVGAAHKPGILHHLQNDIPPSRIDEISSLPPRSSFSRALPWVLPALVIGLFVWGALNSDLDSVRNAAVAWVLANGLLSALGAIVALGHPITVLAAFLAAPLTSLNPTIGAGMVTAFVQTWASAPKVSDFQTIGDDVQEARGWWTNRLGRILLVFLFSSIGSSLGTFLAFGWLKNLL